MEQQIEHKDRSGRLFVFGLLVTAAGALSIGLGLLHLALPRLARQMPGLEFDRALILTGLLTYSAIGGALIATGVGSIRCKRWARAAMLTVGWSWLFVGAGTVGFVVTNLDDLTILAGAGLASTPPEVELLIRLLTIVPTILIGMIVPAVILWIYRDADLLATCRARHPQPDWSDRCPSTILVLALALAFTGLLSLPMALRPVLPWFGRLLTGTEGSIAVLVSGLLFGWIGWLLFQIKPLGWWATGIVSSVLGLSTVLTLIRVPTADWYRALGYSEKQIEQLAVSGGGQNWFGVAATVVLTILTWAYLAAIKKHFRQP